MTKRGEDILRGMDAPLRLGRRLVLVTVCTYLRQHFKPDYGLGIYLQHSGSRRSSSKYVHCLLIRLDYSPVFSISKQNPIVTISQYKKSHPGLSVISSFIPSSPPYRPVLSSSHKQQSPISLYIASYLIICFYDPCISF